MVIMSPHFMCTSVFPFVTQDCLFFSGTSQTICKEGRQTISCALLWGRGMTLNRAFLHLIQQYTQHTRPTFFTGCCRLLVSNANMASLAPMNSMPVVRSKRKVLKLVTPLNSRGPRTRSVWRGEKRETSPGETSNCSL